MGNIKTLYDVKWVRMPFVSVKAHMKNYDV